MTERSMGSTVMEFAPAPDNDEANPTALPPNWLDSVVSRPATAAGVVIGTVMGFNDCRVVQVALGPGSEPLPARSVVPLDQRHVGQEVVLLFEGGDSRKPIIMGLVQPPAPAVEVTRDGQRLVLTAEQEITLRCGEASITLTRAGKILIRGNYLLNRSTGVNQIKGGSVQIN